MEPCLNTVPALGQLTMDDLPDLILLNLISQMGSHLPSEPTLLLAFGTNPSSL
jgi:hypothetical protein